MNIIINDLISISTEDNCFVLIVGIDRYYYKSFDLLLTRMVRELIIKSDLDTVAELVNTMKEINDMIYGIYSVSGMYDDIKMNNRKYTGVGYGQ